MELRPRGPGWHARAAAHLGSDASADTSEVNQSAGGALTLSRICRDTKARSPPSHHSSQSVPPKLRRWLRLRRFRSFCAFASCTNRALGVSVRFDTARCQQSSNQAAAKQRPGSGQAAATAFRWQPQHSDGSRSIQMAAAAFRQPQTHLCGAKERRIAHGEGEPVGWKHRTATQQPRCLTLVAQKHRRACTLN